MKVLAGLCQIPGRHGHRTRAELDALFTHLGQAQRNLKHAAADLETRFLATASELITLSQCGEQFVRQVEKLVGLAAGKDCDSNAFSSAVQLVERAIEFLDDCHQQTSRMLDRSREYHSQIERLLGFQSELERTMLPLKFVQTLFKVESAPLGPGVQQMFTALTQEIEGLHSQVQEVFGTRLEETRRVMGQVMAQLETLARLLQKAATTHKAQIESSLSTLRKELSSNQQRDARLAQVSKELARETDQVVIGLQFQDIINQKLQHVLAALPKVETKFGEFRAAPHAASASAALQFLNQSCRLEAGQIEVAQQELAKTEATIQQSIQNVLNHLTEEDSRCLSLQEFALLTTSFDSMVRGLVNMIEEVRSLIIEIVASAGKAYEMLLPLGRLASDLAAVVRGTSARIRLIGLNAQVQAAHAAQDPRGAGLEILSARTSEISAETDCVSEQAAAQLDTIAAGLAESVNAFEALRTEALAQQTMLNDQGRVQEQQLHAFRDEALELLRTIDNALEKIRNQAQRALNSIDLAEFHQVIFPDLRSPLLGIADQAECLLLAQGQNVSQPALVEDLQRNYTMASERQVFASVLAAQPPALSIPDAIPDIELFGDLPASVAEDAPSPDADDLFAESETPQEAVCAPTKHLEAVPPEPVPVGAPSEDGDLGDNVELF